MSDARLDLVTVGEAMVLLQPPADHRLADTSSLDIHVAGAELNVAAATARFGVRTALCCALGADPLGDRIRATVDRLRIDARLLRTDSARPTGLFLKDVAPDGARRVHYYRSGSAASAMSAADADAILAERPTTILTSGLTAALGPGPYELVRRLAEGARAADCRLALDANIRPQLGDVSEQGARIRAVLPGCHTLLIGADEAGPVFGTAEPAAIIAAAHVAGVPEVVVKVGADGLWVSDADANDPPMRIPSAVTQVVDPVGAGDAVAGGYLVGRSTGLSAADSGWLGTQLAAGIIATLGDITGLPSVSEATELRRTADGISPSFQ